MRASKYEVRLAPAAQLDPLAPLGVRLGRLRDGPLFGVLGLDGDLRRAQLALKVRRPRLDRVQFRALFVGQRVGQRKLGHPAAFLRLTFAKRAQPLLYIGHYFSLPGRLNTCEKVVFWADNFNSST